MDPKSLISLEKVTISFGKNLVLEDVNMEIKEGEIFGIVGLSGSGKTTLLNLIAGVIEADSGVVSYRMPSRKRKAKQEKGTKKAGDEKASKEQENANSEFIDIRKKRIKVREFFGFAAQDPSVYEKLTVTENLNYFGSMYGIDSKTRKENSATLLTLVGLGQYGNQMTNQLSGGMMKRLDIACSLIHNPRVLILDEPTSDLDPLLREQMLAIIKKINERGTTVIVASHFLNDMERLCNRIGILHQRTVGTIGTPDHIKSMYTQNDEIHIETYPGRYDDLAKQLKGMKGLKISKVVNLGHKLVIYTPQAIKVMHAVLDVVDKRKEHLIDIDLAKPTLREVFESLVKGDRSG